MTEINYRREATLPIMGRVGISFYCLSSVFYKLYEKTNEFDRQKQIKHLGLISHEFEGVSHSRYEYLMLQCAISDLFDYIHKGTSTTQGEISYGGKKYKGNGLLKSWCMLSNFGHTKYTYGDEKALSLFSKSKESKYRNRILSSIKDTALRKWCRNVIDGFQYHKFHYVLAIWRVYRELKGNVKDKEDCLVAIKLLLLDYEDFDVNVNKGKVNQLRSLFKKIRDISIVSIDGHNSHTPVSVDLISSIMSADISNNNPSVFKYIKDIRSHLHEEIYLDVRVLARQRSYEIESLDYIRSNAFSNQYYDEITIKAIEDGLVDVKECSLTHFCRCLITKEMQPDTDFYDELRNVLVKIRRKCKNVECSLDVNPFNGNRYVDFYMDNNSFTKRDLAPFLYGVIELIDDQISHLLDNVLSKSQRLVEEIRSNIQEAGVDEHITNEALTKSSDVMFEIAWSSISKYAFPLFESLLWSCLKYFIDSKYILQMGQAYDDYKTYSMYIPYLNSEVIKMDIDDAIKKERHDLDRVHELQQLRKAATIKFDGYKIASLARINIIDPTLPPGKKIVTDIDSVLLKITEKEIILELYEAKNTKANPEGKAAADLRKKVVPTLSKNSAGYRVKNVKNMGAKIVIK